jgi:hypothetical protein
MDGFGWFCDSPLLAGHSRKLPFALMKAASIRQVLGLMYQRAVQSL